MQILHMLLEITIYATVIYAVTIIIKRLFKDKLSPFLHYAIWSLFILRLLLPVTVVSPVQFIVLPESAPAVAEQAENADIQTPTTGALLDGNAALLIHPPIPSDMPGAQDMPAQPAPAAAAKTKLPAATILLIVWLTGVGIGIAYLAVLYSMLRRRIIKNAVKPAKRLCILYRAVRKELGVKAKVPLVCQYGLDSPGILFPACVLMPMEALAAMDDEQVKHALRHELTHYQRGDQVVSILLSVLNAVYWFNPVVWLAMKEIRADMETACDSRVVRRMSAREKGDYANLILELFSRSRYRQVVLGMAHGKTKSVAEQRIKGIFMNGKSKADAKAICVMMTVTLLVGCFTTACVPKTRDDIAASAIGGADEPSKPMLAATPTAIGNAHVALQTLAEAGYVAPNRWEGETKGENYRIVYSADVTASKDMLLGASQCRRIDFTQAQIDQIVQYFTGGAKLYVWPKVKDKTDYAAEIAEAEKGDFVDGAYVVTSDSRQLVSELQKQQSTAPDKVERVYTDTTLTYGYDNDGTRHTDQKCVVSVGVDFDNDGDAAIVVSNGVIQGRTNTWMYYAKGRLLDAETIGMNGDPTDPNPRYANWLRLLGELENDDTAAIIQANQVLADLGIVGMTLVKTEDCILRSWNNEGGLDARTEDAAARLLTFVPETAVGLTSPLPYPYAYAGSRMALTGESGATPDGVAYGLRDIGLLQIAVSDNGIEYFQWRTPAETDTAVIAYEALLPFAEVQARVKEIFTTIILPDEIPPVPNGSFLANIRVQDIELIYYPVLNGDTVEDYAIMPVWRVTYRVALDVVHGDGREIRVGKSESRPSLLISAINGTLIVTK